MGLRAALQELAHSYSTWRKKQRVPKPPLGEGEHRNTKRRINQPEEDVPKYYDLLTREGPGSVYGPQ